MGGVGSGRPPNPETIVNRLMPRSPEPLTPIATDIYLPNYSGVNKSIQEGVVKSTTIEASGSNIIVYGQWPAFQIEGSGGGASSPLTTKGDIWGYSTTDARLPVGSNGSILVADSSQTLGIKWSGGSVSSATFDLNASGSLVAGVADQKVKILGISMHNNESTATNDMTIRLKNDSGTWSGSNLYGGTGGAIYLQGVGGYFGLPLNSMNHYLETSGSAGLWMDIGANARRVSGVVWYRQEA